MKINVIEGGLNLSLAQPSMCRNSGYKDPMMCRNSGYKDPMMCRNSGYKDPMMCRNSGYKDPVARDMETHNEVLRKEAKVV